MKNVNSVQVTRSPVTRHIPFQGFGDLVTCKPRVWAGIFFLLLPGLNGCHSVEGNVGRVNSYVAPYVEADWIRNGEPIEFENELWYPADGTESFQDSEMQLLGKVRGVEFFIDKVDVRPYERLYTKFARNKFRFYEKKTEE